MVVKVADKCVVELWGKWFCHPSFGNYRDALVSNQMQMQDWMKERIIKRTHPDANIYVIKHMIC